ncbi:MAG: hypothetical protein AAFN07_16915 [Pseudomonadota bacterium]
MHDLPPDRTPDGFFIQLLKGIVGSIVQATAAFAVGTGAAAAACWYYGLPWVLALGGGFVVLALWLAITTDSIFD